MEQLNADSLYEIATSMENLVYDDESKMFFDRARDMYYDQTSGVYYDYKKQVYYRKDGG